jgi:hypothetical protein
MYQSTIIIKHDIDEIEKLFMPEQKDLGRSSFTVKKIKNELVFDIKADDATALKTVLNTITKIFIVWDKTKQLKKD